MNYKPKFNYNTKTIVFDLRKPIYGSYYAVWEKWFKGKESWTVVINTPEGTSTFTNFSTYKDGADRMERFFKNPRVPMIFWGRDIKPDIHNRNERKGVSMKQYQDSRYKLAQLFEKYR